MAFSASRAAVIVGKVKLPVGVLPPVSEVGPLAATGAWLAPAAGLSCSSVRLASLADAVGSKASRHRAKDAMRDIVKQRNLIAWKDCWVNCDCLAHDALASIYDSRLLGYASHNASMTHGPWDQRS